MKVASLNGSLLVRKGAAQPSALHAATGGATPSAAPGPAAPRPPAGETRVRVTLRLAPARHRRLRLAAAHMGCSLQEVLAAALERYLDETAPHIGGPAGCACLAETRRAPADAADRPGAAP